ncbi:histone H2A [Tubulinosema ratisbonensis]|uniref:Histone H2A n=1 Tax=Tubulinosema ratisbonensis TaxID=291195 RepID=A0A437ALJ7_9MICR|nr:histone H2A [Tubulinosema ratisbonensis]
MASTKGAGKRDPAAKSEEFDVKSAIKMSHVKRVIKNKTRRKTSKVACHAVAIAVYVIIKEIVIGAMEAADLEHKKKILPKHINLAMHKDADLVKISSGVLVRSGGVSNVIPPEMLRRKQNDKE